MTNELIVALDFQEWEPCQKLLEELQGLVKIYKIGSELFTAHGWKAVERVQKSGAEVFLDLKLHDIPTTVARTSRVIAERGIFMFNVHTLGGLEMMREARKAIEGKFSKGRRPLLLGVTVLTSHTQATLSKELGISQPLSEEVIRLARLAKEAGLDGVISSPEETEHLRKEFGNDFVLVTPGIRPPGSEPHDQRRFLSPREAKACGANYLVVGRPITATSHPRETTQEILHSLA